MGIGVLVHPLLHCYQNYLCPHVQDLIYCLYNTVYMYIYTLPHVHISIPYCTSLYTCTCISTHVRTSLPYILSTCMYISTMYHTIHMYISIILSCTSICTSLPYMHTVHGHMYISTILSICTSLPYCPYVHLYHTVHMYISTMHTFHMYISTILSMATCTSLPYCPWPHVHLYHTLHVHMYISTILSTCTSLCPPYLDYNYLSTAVTSQNWDKTTLREVRACLCNLTPPVF